MRDLQADLEYVTNPPSGGLEYWRKRSIAIPNIAKHAIERAIKAESLNRELVEALDIAVKELLFAGAFEVVVDRRITRVIIKALFKAKEAMGDDS